MALLGSQSTPRCATVGACEYRKRPPQRSVSSPKQTPNVSDTIPRAEFCIVKAICCSTSPIFSRRCCKILLETCCSHNDPLILSYSIFGCPGASSIVSSCFLRCLFHCVPFTVSFGRSARYDFYLVLSNPLHHYQWHTNCFQFASFISDDSDLTQVALLRIIFIQRSSWLVERRVDAATQCHNLSYFSLRLSRRSCHSQLFSLSSRLQHRQLLIFSSSQHPLRLPTSLHFRRLPLRHFGHSQMFFLSCFPVGFRLHSVAGGRTAFFFDFRLTTLMALGSASIRATFGCLYFLCFSVAQLLSVSRDLPLFLLCPALKSSVSFLMQFFPTIMISPFSGQALQ